MEEIEFEVSSPFIKTLVYLAEEFGVKEFLYPKTICGNKHFVVFIPPVANGDNNSPDNIYVDDDFFSTDDDARGEYTLSYGFGHIHFEAGPEREGVVGAARRTLQFVKDLIEGRIIGFHLKTEFGMDVTGYTANRSDEELKEEFLKRCESYATYSMASGAEQDGMPFVRLCYWNKEELRKIDLV